MTSAVSRPNTDVIVIGAGIVGLATAMEILRRAPGAKILVVDKEERVARHQTSHNSGVIHRGVYYTPGSLKARLCVDGARRLLEFCSSREIPYRLIGKLIVAATESELPALDELRRRAEANGVPAISLVSESDIPKIEPHIVGAAALHSPKTGIVDFSAVATAYADEVRSGGGTILLGRRVTQMRERVDHMEITAGGQRMRAGVVVACAGLQSDRIAAMTERRRTAPHVVPFRGDYYLLRRGASVSVRSLVYPVPDPRFPFLGVHFTPRMNGDVWLGPNAVLAFAREGYRFRSFSLGDTAETLLYPGFWRLARRHWKVGAAEMWRDVSRGAFAAALRRYMPSIRDEDLVGHTSGVRAQAVQTDGALLDDFSITGHHRIVHVRNAPSPAATSSLAIGDAIARTVFERLETTNE